MMKRKQHDALLVDGASDDSDDDDGAADFSAPSRGGHNYHASRIELPPLEQIEFTRTLEESIELEEESASKEMAAMTRFIEMFGAAIPLVFGGALILMASLFIAGFVDATLQKYLIWAMLALLMGGASLGMFAVFRYGVIGDAIEDLCVENDDYKNELKKLKAQNLHFKNEVRGLKTAVSELRHDEKQLTEQTEKFEGLVRELKAIGEENADIASILEDTQRIFGDMRKVVLENERAHLLTTFYECAFKANSDSEAMGPAEYIKFEARLSKRQRARFAELGRFKELAGDDGKIDLNKFQDCLELVLEDVDELLRHEFAHSQNKSNKQTH